MGVTDCPISIIIVSHNKPGLLPEAVASVMGQTFENWQGVLIDSGVLYEQGFFDRFPWSNDPRLRVLKSPETAALRRHKAMAPWCFNESFRRGWARGELIMYLCDDDILYPDAFATFVDAFRTAPHAMAMYASQDIAWIDRDGRTVVTGRRRATTPGGKRCDGRIMDCQVDYLQLCHRRSALSAFSGDEYWPEAKTTSDHADGLFMEKLGSYWPILPIDVTIGQNRRTQWSVNLPARGPVNEGGHALPPPHETIMEAWSEVRRLVEQHSDPSVVHNALTEFQSQLRLFCEEDLCRRRALVSRRYLMADRFHRFLACVPGALRCLKLLGVAG